jgi:anti-sigma-K factor RskA
MAREKPGAAVTAARQARLQSAELERRQKLWRWLILATLAVVLVETWLAGRTARRSAGPLEATS